MPVASAGPGWRWFDWRFAEAGFPIKSIPIKIIGTGWPGRSDKDLPRLAAVVTKSHKAVFSFLVQV
jgi:hypothetical protein